jgi:hypothetical protein
VDRVDEIEATITRLPPEEYRRLADWFRAREQSRWDDKSLGVGRCGPLKPRRI